MSIMIASRGSIGAISSVVEIFGDAAADDGGVPTGGVIRPNVRFTTTMMPRWIGSSFSGSAKGSRIGTIMITPAYMEALDRDWRPNPRCTGLGW